MMTQRGWHLQNLGCHNMIIVCRVCCQFRLPTVACQELRILSVTWPLHGTDLSIKSISVDAAGCFFFLEVG